MSSEDYLSSDNNKFIKHDITNKHLFQIIALNTLQLLDHLYDECRKENH